jgi:hypothetical protein
LVERDEGGDLDDADDRPRGVRRATAGRRQLEHYEHARPDVEGLQCRVALVYMTEKSCLISCVAESLTSKSAVMVLPSALKVAFMR